MKRIDIQLDDIYDGVDCLMWGGCWVFLNEHLDNLTPKIWRMNLDIVLGYATATFPGKSKLPSRAAFMNECIRRYPDPELWKGLE
jgi:hypothetical protein